MIRQRSRCFANGSRKLTPIWKSHGGWRRKLRALLNRRQIEFPKTHDIKTLLHLVGDPVADALAGAKWLTPFGVEIRYPSDTAEMLPGDQVKAIEIASQVKQVVLAVLARG